MSQRGTMVRVRIRRDTRCKTWTRAGTSACSPGTAASVGAVPSGGWVVGLLLLVLAAGMSDAHGTEPSVREQALVDAWIQTAWTRPGAPLPGKSDGRRLTVLHQSHQVIAGRSVWGEARITLRDGSAWWLDQTPLGGWSANRSNVPFSLRLGGVESAVLLPDWEFRRQSRVEPDRPFASTTKAVVPVGDPARLTSNCDPPVDRRLRCLPGSVGPSDFKLHVLLTVPQSEM